MFARSQCLAAVSSVIMIILSLAWQGMSEEASGAAW
jgi:hypothetical protein